MEVKYQPTVSSLDQRLIEPFKSSPNSTDLGIIMGYVYFYLTGIMSGLSMTGSLVIIIIFYKKPYLQTTGRRLLVYLSIADFLTALGNLLGIIWSKTKDAMSSKSSDVFCDLHASLTFFSSISSFLWTVAIGVHLFVCIVILNASRAEKMIPAFHVICWGIPAIIAIVSLSLGVIGYDKTLEQPSWCWIDPDTEVVNALFWQYLTGKAWEIAAYVTTVVLYATVKARLTQQMRQRKKQIKPSGAHKTANSSVISNANKKLTFVPAVFIAIRIWGTLRFILGNHFGIEQYWIAPLQGVGDSAQGFANCILFLVMTNSLRQEIHNKCCHSCAGTIEPETTECSLNDTAIRTHRQNTPEPPNYNVINESPSGLAEVKHDSTGFGTEGQLSHTDSEIGSGSDKILICEDLDLSKKESQA